jgi:hypothetical protein
MAWISSADACSGARRSATSPEARDATKTTMLTPMRVTRPNINRFSKYLFICASCQSIWCYYRHAKYLSRNSSNFIKLTLFEGFYMCSSVFSTIQPEFTANPNVFPGKKEG